MRTIGFAILLGVLFGVTADLLTFTGSRDYVLLAKIAGLSAAKAAVIGWLVPRSVQWLPLAILFGMLLGTVFWAAVPSRGVDHEYRFELWNLIPGALLGLILVVIEWRKPARVRMRERNRQAS